MAFIGGRLHGVGTNVAEGPRLSCRGPASQAGAGGGGRGRRGGLRRAQGGQRAAEPPRGGSCTQMPAGASRVPRAAAPGTSSTFTSRVPPSGLASLAGTLAGDFAETVQPGLHGPRYSPWISFPAHFHFVLAKR